MSAKRVSNGYMVGVVVGVRKLIGIVGFTVTSTG